MQRTDYSTADNMLNKDTNSHTNRQSKCLYTLCILEKSEFERLQEVPVALFQVSFKRVSLGVEAANLLPTRSQRVFWLSEYILNI